MYVIGLKVKLHVCDGTDKSNYMYVIGLIVKLHVCDRTDSQITCM